MSRRKRIVLLALDGVLLLLALGCLIGVLQLSRLLPSQEEARRWQGSSDLRYSQISAFIPVDDKRGVSDIYEFRGNLMKKLHEAALDVDRDETLFVDAWSTTGKALAATDLGRGEAAVIAVGGQFFDFHPLRLLNGAYFSERDLMKDRVLLDEELAWLLFGGTQLQGMTLKIDGVPFQVGGVIQRERDFASRKAYTAGMGLYMSYDAWSSLHEEAGITTYELVMAEPVDGFAIGFAREKFPIGQGELLENTDRFSFARLLGLVGKFGTRSMQRLGVMYPYWENAARCLEDWCSLLTLLGLLFACPPAVTALVYGWKALRRGKEKLSEELLPAAKDRAEEALRVRQRRRWEKRHRDSRD